RGDSRQTSRRRRRRPTLARAGFVRAAAPFAGGPAHVAAQVFQLAYQFFQGPFQAVDAAVRVALGAGLARLIAGTAFNAPRLMRGRFHWHTSHVHGRLGPFLDLLVDPDGNLPVDAFQGALHLPDHGLKFRGLGVLGDDDFDSDDLLARAGLPS